MTVIQGTVDVDKTLTQAEIAQTINFCVNAFQNAGREEQDALMNKIKSVSETKNGEETDVVKKLKESLSADERRTLNTIQARQIIRSEDTMNIDNFTVDVIDGMVPNLKRGSLGLLRYVPKVKAGQQEDELRAKLGLPEKQESIFSY